VFQPAVAEYTNNQPFSTYYRWQTTFWIW
jgi:hypothetical protein